MAQASGCSEQASDLPFNEIENCRTYTAEQNL
jgi:hypothetical protein